jgi:hypothetical protein
MAVASAWEKAIINWRVGNLVINASRGAFASLDLDCGSGTSHWLALVGWWAGRWVRVPFKKR